MADTDQNVTMLPEKIAPATGDKMMVVGGAEEYLIDYKLLARAMLDELKTKEYAGLGTTAKNVIDAISELNSKSIPIAIKSGDDMNDYTYNGQYYSASASVTNTLVNTPAGVEYGFAMLVLKINTNQVQVIIQGGSGNIGIFIRSFTSTSSWQSWFKFAGTKLSS